MKFLITLEPIEKGFSVQVPDLAIITFGESIEAAKRAAVKAIKINLDAYREADQIIPENKPILTHLENPDFKNVLFAYVNVNIEESSEKKAA